MIYYIDDNTRIKSSRLSWDIQVKNKDNWYPKYYYPTREAALLAAFRLHISGKKNRKEISELKDFFKEESRFIKKELKTFINNIKVEEESTDGSKN